MLMAPHAAKVTALEPSEEMRTVMRKNIEEAGIENVEILAESWPCNVAEHHDYSFRHSMFVCGSLSYFAHAIGIRGDELDQLTLGGLLHDIGKARIPLEILDKPGKLDDNEWVIMKQHPVHSRDILGDENDLDTALIAMAVFHHEKLDGAGYPRQLQADQIPLQSRMMTIADIYDALTASDRPYKKAVPHDRAIMILESEQKHNKIDRELLDVFVEAKVHQAVGL